MPSGSNDLQLFRYRNDAGKLSPVATADLSDTDFARYVSFINTMVSHFKPDGPEEETIARSVAEMMYQLDRIHVIEMILLCGQADPEEVAANPLLGKFMRSKNPLSALSLHQARLSRQYDAACRMLRERQEARRQSKN